MKKVVLSLLVLICVAVFFSCYYHQDITGSGVIVERELAYVDFDSLDFYLGGDITVIPSDSYGITLSADDNIIDHITVYPADAGKILQFGLDWSAYYRQTSISIEVRTPGFEKIRSRARHNTGTSGLSVSIADGFSSLDEVNLDFSSGCSVRFNTLSATQITIDYGGSDFSGGIACDELELNMSNAKLSLSGSARNLFLTANQSSEIDLSELTVTEAEVDIRQSAEANIYVTDVLTGFVGLDATLIYEDVAGLDTTGLETEEPEVEEESVE